MLESKIITLPRPMSLVRRISEVTMQIRGWLESLDKPLPPDGKYTLQLTKSGRNNGEYCYYYSIIRGKGLSAFSANVRTDEAGLDDLPDASLTSATYSQTEGPEKDL